MSTTGSNPTEVNVVATSNLVNPFAKPNPLSQSSKDLSVTPVESIQVAEAPTPSPFSRPNPLTQPQGTEGSEPQEAVEIAVIKTDLPYDPGNLLIASQPETTFRPRVAIPTISAPTTPPFTTIAPLPFESVNIVYSWNGTDQYDLDTATRAFDETVGYDCQNSYEGNYMTLYSADATFANGYEAVEVYTDKAKNDGLWSDSYTILCYADWYPGALGAGPAMIMATYRGSVKIKMIFPGSENPCASTPVAAIVVSSLMLTDGSFLDLI